MSFEKEKIKPEKKEKKMERSRLYRKEAILQILFISILSGLTHKILAHNHRAVSFYDNTYQNCKEPMHKKRKKVNLFL